MGEVPLYKCVSYRRPMPRVIGGSYGGGIFLIGEVPLYESVSFGAEEPRLTKLVDPKSLGQSYRGTSLIRNTHPPRTTVGP